VSAVLALSPYSQPFVAHGTLKNLGAPVMYQGGTRDFGITPFLRREGGAFDASPAPKYYVEFTGAGHFAWTNLNSVTHTLILQYSLPFVDHYLRGAPDEALTRSAPGVSDLRHVP
jgi:predicted dienelactone hydrolase